MRLLVNVFTVFNNTWSKLNLIRGQNFPRLPVVAFLTTMHEQSTVDIFQGNIDRFNGITICSESETCSADEFTTKLDKSLQQWKDDGRRGIWFKVHLDQSDWVPILAKKGFRYHHAKDDFVMMCLWLPVTENCNIPPYAHTTIGVGAIVINEKSEILVVSEKYFVHAPHWKLPGGYVEPGENLVDAAIREVWEETGIKTEFHSVISFRQTHYGMFGCSDIYTVVSLKPLSAEIEKCEREIAECRWMDVDEYLNHPNVIDSNRFFVQKYLEYKKKNIKINWHHGMYPHIKKPYTVYYVENNDKSS